MDYAVIVNEVIDYSEIITGSIPLQINKLNNIGNKINASQTQTNARTRSIKHVAKDSVAKETLEWLEELVALV